MNAKYSCCVCTERCPDQGQNGINGREAHIAQEADALECFEECIGIEDALPRLDLAARDRSNAGAVALSLYRYHLVNADKQKAAFYRAKAESHFIEARNYFRANGPAESLRNVLNNLAAFYVEERQFAPAVEGFKEALGLLAPNLEGDDKDFAIVISGNLGSCYGEIGQYKEAFQYLSRAIEHLNTIPVPESQPYLICHAMMGKLLCKDGRPTEAHPYLSKARTKLDELRGSFVAELTNLQLLKNFNWVYEWSIVCLSALASGDSTYAAEAFELAERVKWRLLTALLRYLPLGFVNAGEEPLVAEEEKLLGEIFDALGSPAEATVLRNPAAAARLEKIWDTLEPRHPDYVSIRRQITASAARISACLDDDVPVLLEFYLGEESNLAIGFRLTKDKRVTCQRLRAGASEVIDLIRGLKEQTHKQPVADFNRISQELYQILVEPLPSFTGDFPDRWSGLCKYAIRIKGRIGPECGFPQVLS